jgi:hypothetical protein
MGCGFLKQQQQGKNGDGTDKGYVAYRHKKFANIGTKR